ncbi:SDR family NAD(P)-dependent oxidoreductase [Halegenticoccus tardaugens]|uniref:SDR family NAD(P)-dependent oxidoreductase n=1 Tax=Halegenticoccus tardaugens TaxID=2071624 RepID=UPI00100AF669|nr:SDR family NAD(P)-dependent oxidoreductase [Halegenticoccus tardaugens]
MKIQGETAFVTGGSRGIGRLISIELASHDITVVVGDLDASKRERTVKEIEDAGGAAIETYLDLTDSESVTGAIADARATVGPIDIFINNAGIAGPTAPIEDVSLDEWDTTLSINLSGAFLCVREVIGEMKSRGYGRVINISSSSGKRAVPMRSPYASSKAGMLGLTRTIAAEGGPHGVTANAICPGPVNGPRIDDVIDRRAANSEQSRDEIVDEKQQESLVCSFVEPDDIAKTVSYLCSDATDRITGQALNVSGGKIIY